MNIAEKLYNKGLISYPRTETTIYNKNINIKSLVNKQKLNPDEEINAYVKMMKINVPNNGKLDDQAHPPIHPVEIPNDEHGLTEVELKIYNFIVKHFLACVSQNAIYYETKVILKVDQEEFIAKGIKLDPR